ncbi:MAG: YgiQ family radical SAM protein [Desulfobacteraceae bacterium]|nr:YgiQ family radical SAM protein [Desulfobacteraceae bacterium]
MQKRLRQPEYLPTTLEEMHSLGWDRPDVIIITGDTYIDSPYIGAAVIGRVLINAGYRVGIIAQPDIDHARDISRFGEPGLFWAVTSGSLDSMVANYTALGKPRRSDDLTPGGKNVKRPDRAVIVYSNLIRRYFKKTKPIVLGGIEASLRRISHYDAWSGRIRRSVVFDAKADILVYGMGEKAVCSIARSLENQQDIRSIRGICYISPSVPPALPDLKIQDIELPSHKAVSENTGQFARMFQLFHENAHPLTAGRLYQLQDTRYLVQNPPSVSLSSHELDMIYELPYSRDAHPFYSSQGAIPALDTIRFSLNTHRGCYGQCRFCAIAVHQGTQVISRSQESILREAAGFVRHPAFKGIVSDVGGPTANMYSIECSRKKEKGPCKNKACLFPKPCSVLSIRHEAQIKLLKRLLTIPGIRKVFIGSGIRYDMILYDDTHGAAYLEQLLRHHVSGQLKIAPEHTQDHVLSFMGKPDRLCLEAFLRMHERINKKQKRKTFLTYYLMAAYPGCTLEDMRALKRYARTTLGHIPKQIQIFTPCPSTYATSMYYTETDPFSRKKLYIAKTVSQKKEQKEAITGKPKFKKKNHLHY